MKMIYNLIGTIGICLFIAGCSKTEEPKLKVTEIKIELERRVARGPGAWKDISYYLDSGSRTYEYQDTAKSWIGNHVVLTRLGRGEENHSDSI